MSYHCLPVWSQAVLLRIADSLLARLAGWVVALGLPLPRPTLHVLHLAGNPSPVHIGSASENDWKASGKDVKRGKVNLRFASRALQRVMEILGIFCYKHSLSRARHQVQWVSQGCAGKINSHCPPPMHYPRLFLGLNWIILYLLFALRPDVVKKVLKQRTAGLVEFDISRGNRDAAVIVLTSKWIKYSKELQGLTSLL